ncbi:MAG: FeoA family protein [Anaerolineaceae bacterium]|nr:FeoA family protein [Anaerolineaceae bacterium]
MNRKVFWQVDNLLQDVSTPAGPAPGKVGEGQDLYPLSVLQHGQQGSITAIAMESALGRQKLYAAGVRPDTPVRVINNHAPYIVFRAGEREFAADYDVAEGILVQVSR